MSEPRESRRSFPARIWTAYRRRQGTVLIAVVIVATLWLAMTGQLVLYIHPRYVVFTVGMALVGLIFIVASFIRSPDSHSHEHDDEPAATAWQNGLSIAGGAITLVMAVALIVVPPATLTTATANQREINSTGLGSVANAEDLTAASDETFATFTVRDWASLLRQTTDVGFYADKQADVVGFIAADQDDPQNAFYVSRFVVTCCAVDAQPVGVLVHLENWQGKFEADQWVEVAGTFAANPSRSSDQPLALIPTDVTPRDQPGEPYLY